MRLRDNMLLPVLHTHADGSYDSVLDAIAVDPGTGAGSHADRDVLLAPQRTVYRLSTTLSPEQASAGEVAGVYCEHWEAEQGLNEIKAQYCSVKGFLPSNRWPVGPYLVSHMGHVRTVPGDALRKSA